MTLQTTPQTQAPQAAMTVQQKLLPTYDARALTQAGDQAQILLDDQTYFLRITRAGKLILTK
jgi:hemin uptake protein HemP